MLTDARAIAVFDDRLKDSSSLAMFGQIIDSSLIPVPRQRNTEVKNDAIEDGQSAAEIWPDPARQARAKAEPRRARR